MRTLYKDEQGSPLELSDGQAEIFLVIFRRGLLNTGRRMSRAHIETVTQYGKSLTVALAVLTRITTFPEKWIIVAPTLAKAQIILGYVIVHSFDNDFTKTKLRLEEGETLDRLRRERSKRRLTYRVGDNRIGEVMVISVDARNKQAAGDAAMGFGAANVVEDESALIEDDIHAKIFRMIAGQRDNFFCKIGNPFRKGKHFVKSQRDGRYLKIKIEWRQGVAEGRISPEVIEEARGQPFFDVLYEIRMPPEESVDDKGYVPLLTEADIERAFSDQVAHTGESRLGVDVKGEGTNWNIWIRRSASAMEKVRKDLDDNLMSVGATTIGLLKEHEIRNGLCYIDKIGVGQGAYNFVQERGHNPRGVNVGEPATDIKQFANKKAEAYWRLRQWIKSGGKIKRDPDFLQLADVRYKSNEKRQLIIMTKEEMLRRGIESPDVAEAAMLTFVEPENAAFLRDQLRAVATRRKIDRNVYQ